MTVPDTGDAEARHAGASWQFLLLVLALLLTGLPAARAGVIGDALDSLRHIDIASFYADYSGIIDAVIFLLVFIGLAHLTIGKRLGDSRAGKAVSIGIGLVLALGLMVMEKTMHFSIASFGPYAAGIFVILSASVLYFLLRKLGAGSALSVSATYIVVFFLLQAVVPGFFDYLREHARTLYDLLAVGMLLCVIAAVWRFMAMLWPDSGSLSGLGARLEPVAAGPALTDTARADLGEELRLLRGKLSEIQAKRRKDSDRIVSDIDSITSAMAQAGDTAESRQVIADKLKDIAPRDHKLRTSLRALQKLYERVQRLELGALAELRKLPPDQAKTAKKQIKAELQKLKAGERIKAIADKIEAHDSVFRERLSKAVEELNQGRTGSAMELLKQARDSEAKTQELSKEIDELTRLLRSLTAKQIAGSEEK